MRKLCGSCAEVMPLCGKLCGYAENYAEIVRSTASESRHVARYFFHAFRSLSQVSGLFVFASFCSSAAFISFNILEIGLPCQREPGFGPLAMASITVRSGPRAVI